MPRGVKKIKTQEPVIPIENYSAIPVRELSLDELVTEQERLSNEYDLISRKIKHRLIELRID